MLVQIQSVHQLNTSVNHPFCPMMCAWSGEITNSIQLPQLGHLIIVFPLSAKSTLLCDSTRIESEHYAVFNADPVKRQLTLAPTADTSTPVLILMLSPGFIADLGNFLGIPTDFEQLLIGVPLRQGDTLSDLLQLLATRLNHRREAQELLMETIGQILRFFRHRHEALQALNQHKNSTIEDLVPRLLQARQFIESNFIDDIKTADVADHVLLSEFHFARLFKASFEMTVHQYVIRLRLNEARYRLEHDTQSITNISLDIGYNSMSAFIHAFRKYSGQTPSQYRAQFQ